MSSSRTHVQPLENTWRYRGLSFSFCETHYRSQQMIRRAPLWPDSPWICEFYSLVLWGQGILAPNQQRTCTLQWKLTSSTGAGPARSTPCRTGPAIFSHLSVWPLWGFFAAVAIRSLQQQGLRKLKLQKQWDTFNSCLSCIHFAEVKGGENASWELFYYCFTQQ